MRMDIAASRARVRAKPAVQTAAVRHCRRSRKAPARVRAMAANIGLL